MKNLQINPSWSLIGDSVRGNKHLLNSLPNQDAYQWRRKGNNLVVAVSDGHGSLKHFRSDIGAKLAVEAATEVTLAEADIDDFNPNTLPGVRERVKEKLAIRIVNCWRKKVKNYQINNPFIEDEFAQKKLAEIEQKKGRDLRELLENDEAACFKVYGATLLLVLVTEYYLLALQLGDGDIVTMSSAGQTNRLFVNNQLGNATNSLCMSNPEIYFKIKLKSFKQQAPPALIFIATDGYANSFYNDADFLKVGPDFKKLLTTQGLDYIKNNLTAWLKETTKKGSGDDITLVFIYQKQLLTNFL